MFPKEKELKTFCVTEEAQTILRESLLSYCKFLEKYEESRLRRIRGFRRLEKIREFVALLESGASVEALARHPLWCEERLYERLDRAEVLAGATETDSVDT